MAGGHIGPDPREGEEVVVSASIKVEKQPVTLAVTRFRVCAIDEQAGSLKLNIPITLIKKQKVSPAGSKKIKLRLEMADDEGYTFVFVGDNALEQRNTAKECVMQLMQQARAAPHNFELPPPVGYQDAQDKVNEPPTREVLTEDERLAKRKNDLLAISPGLLEKYKELVLSQKLLSDKEFWSDYQRELDDSFNLERQQAGVPSGFLADTRPQEATDSSKTTYRITPDIMHNIFQMYPKVYQRYQETVPVSMTEGEFWKKVIQSHLLHRGSASLEATSREDFLSDIKIVPAEHDEIVKQKLDDNPLLDLGADEDIRKEGYGTGGPTAERKRRRIMQTFNVDSEKILRTLDPNPTPVDAQQELRKAIQLPELQPAPEPTYPKLDLNLTDLFDSTHGAHAGAVMSVQPNGYGVEDPAIPLTEGAAAATLRDIAARIQSNLHCPAPLPARNATSVRKVDEAISVLLRHFWSCFTPTNPKTAFLKTKAKKMAEALRSKKETSLRDFESSLDSEAARQALRPLFVRVETALAKYDAWAATKKRKRP